MELVTLLWSLGAATALTLALVCGLVWLVERRSLFKLMLCLLRLATAASAYGELGMMRAVTAESYGEWLRWYHLPAGMALIAQVLFVHYYLQSSRPWLMWVIVAMRLLVLVVNFSVLPNFNFRSIVSLRHLSLFGEQISILGAAVPRREWQWLSTLSVVLLLVYLCDAAAKGWRRGGYDSRRRAVAVAAGIAGPWCVTALYSQLLVYGVIRVPVSNLPWFLGALTVMVYKLGREFVVSRQARLELAELRAQLAQTERVSVMGQLASALAHELSQPLAATSLNLTTVMVQLEKGASREEVYAILGNIREDERRATEIVNRLRRLFRRRSIAMQPLKLGEVVEDAVALVRPEANAKNVKLHVSLQPELPQVLGDRVHLSQVLLNLLVNSVQALQSCPAEARSISIEAQAAAAGGEVELAVRDSGPGIPDAKLEEIFKPFYTTKAEGLGIGLALSRTIIEAHGGRLWAERGAQQDGATFRFTLQRVGT